MTALSWTDIPEPKTKGSSGQRGESVFADIEVGSNFFRVVSNEIHRALYYWAFGGMQKSADSYETRPEDRICPLSKEFDEKGDPLKPRPYYLLLALERSSGTVKLLRVSQQIIQNMKELASSSQWGDLTKYDINITRRPKGTNPLYMVTPNPPCPLTPEEQALVENCKIKLENYAKPAQIEWVQKFIDERKNGKKGAPRSEAPRPAAAKPAAKPAAPPVTDDFSLGDNDFDIDVDSV